MGCSYRRTAERACLPPRLEAAGAVDGVAAAALHIVLGQVEADDALQLLGGVGGGDCGGGGVHYGVCVVTSEEDGQWCL